jgi:hypothetical protein
MGLAKERRLKAAGELDTASDRRFQALLPFEPVDHSMLLRLRSERLGARAEADAGPGQFASRRRQAQIAARRALEHVVAGVRARGAATAEKTRAFAMAVHAAELQFPDAWLPFVVSR